MHAPVCAALLLAVLTAAGAQLPARSAATASATLPLPAAFAPAPFALPGSPQALEKQLANLLRKLDPVQSAEALLAGEGAQGPTLRVILKARAGQRLTPELIGTVSQILGGAAPGITPEQIIIADNAGKLLYERGQCVVAPPTEPLTGRPWAWPTLVALAALAVVWSVARGPLRRPRGGSSSVPWEEALLGRADPRLVAAMLARERPEVAALVLSRMPAGSERRARRLLKRRGGELPVPVAPVDPRVVQAVMGLIESGAQTEPVTRR